MTTERTGRAGCGSPRLPSPPPTPDGPFGHPVQKALSAGGAAAPYAGFPSPGPSSSSSGSLHTRSMKNAAATTHAPASTEAPA